MQILLYNSPDAYHRPLELRASKTYNHTLLRSTSSVYISLLSKGPGSPRPDSSIDPLLSHGSPATAASTTAAAATAPEKDRISDRVSPSLKQDLTLHKRRTLHIRRTLRKPHTRRWKGRRMLDRSPCGHRSNPCKVALPTRRLLRRRMSCLSHSNSSSVDGPRSDIDCLDSPCRNQPPQSVATSGIAIRPTCSLNASESCPDYTKRREWRRRISKRCARPYMSNDTGCACQASGLGHLNDKGLGQIKTPYKESSERPYRQA